MRSTHRTLVLGLCCVVLLGSGCKLDPWWGGTDAGWEIPDGGTNDNDAFVQQDAEPCVPAVETCDGTDNDCDGVVDNVDATLLADDNSNCGSCGTVCDLLDASAIADCDNGTCVIDYCFPNYWDLNGQYDDGCEYQCYGNTDASEVCNNLDDDCDGLVDEDFDLTTDVLNCGQCMRACSFFRGVGACVGGTCQLDSCQGGYVDKDGNPDNGCECLMSITEDASGIVCDQQNPVTCDTASEVCADGDSDGVSHCAAIPIDICDGVDNDCDAQIDEDATALLGGTQCYNHPVGCTEVAPGAYTCVGTCRAGVPTCVGGNVICGNQVPPAVEVCDGTDNDCNGVVDEGFDLQADMANCGACGYSCLVHKGAQTLPAGCVGGACQFICAPGNHDLNGDVGLGDQGDGCEFACNLTNGGVEACGDGVDNDCNGLVDDGFNYQTDVNNCGTCGTACETIKPFGVSVAGCMGGACQYVCLANYYDLNGDLGLGAGGNGCEYGCVVSGGGVESCDGVDNDCNGQVDEGFNLATDVDNCGSCGTVCTTLAGASSTVTGCANGVCQFACVAGFLDLNGDVSLGAGGDGCEYGCVISGGGVESCDGVDNDCDGQVDEDAGGGPLVQACYTGPAGTAGVGPCQQGSQTCTGGAWGACVGEVLPAVEVCDGVDNDCDTLTDEDAGGAPLPQPCYTGPFGTQDVGTCHGGIRTCSGGFWGGCTGEVIPDQESCDGTDNDCDGSIDEDFNFDDDVVNCGGCGVNCSDNAGPNSFPTSCATGMCQYACQSTYYDLNGDIALGNLGDGCEFGCILTNGGVEACGDGVDNDCDGQTDEGFDLQTDPTNCGACGYACASHAGQNATSTGCAVGVCGFVCNVGYVDLNGDVTTGDAGNGCEYACSLTNGGVEACDNIDNDCDGTADEGFDVQTDLSNCGTCGTVCSSLAGPGSHATACLSGVCKFACDAGSVDLNGDVSNGTSGNGCEYPCAVTNGGVEICDGVDNDCDGQTDETPGGAPLTQVCYSGPVGTAGVGPCQQGLQTCGGGGWGACVGDVVPAAEVCDGVDNDCDGSTDENAGGAPLTQVCYTGPPATRGVGICADGMQTCTGGFWAGCVGEVTPQIEFCDSLDNDCDGSSDEGFDTSSDLNNCGGCGVSCSANAGANSYPTGCVAGVCQFACQSGYFDINGNVALGSGGDGCEYSCTLTNGGVEACGDGIDNDCDGATDEGFDLLTDPVNCGVCSYACASHAGQNSTSTGCVAGACGFVCSAGFMDLNGDVGTGDAGNGCEYPCLVTNGGVEACDSVDNDCDGSIDEGFDLQTDLSHCGACGTVCSALAGANSHATTCTNGVCQYACDAGFVDTNGDVSLGNAGNGCDYGCVVTNGGMEACDGVDNDCDGATDENAGGAPLTQPCYTGTAGTAGVGPCMAGTQTCGGGAWGACLGEVIDQPETCDGVDNDCDGLTDEDGGGSPLSQSCYTGPPVTAGVGTCRNGMQTCAGGFWGGCAGEVTPALETCDSTDNDCDGSIDEDFDLSNNTANCGSCGNSCFANAGPSSYPTACVAGVCQFGCQSGFYDLNGDIALGTGGDGCEYSCTMSNGGVEKCGDGIDNDCDGATDEGFDLQNDPNNCGTCDYACSSHAGQNSTTTGCVTGVCGYVCSAGFVDLNGDVTTGDAGNGCEYPCAVTNGGVEACDSLDNDCDGAIDEGFDTQTDLVNCGACGTVCSTLAGASSSATACAGGVCQFACDAGFIDLNGDVSQGSAGNGCEYGCTVTNGGVEACDGVDNDCDGATDENAGGAPLSRSCYSGTAGTAGVGPCRSGTETCGGGAWGACVGEVVDQPETCDGVDNDCDGLTDEDGGGAPLSQVCYTGPPATRGVGSCSDGTQTCGGGVWGVCSGVVTPQIEACDGLDNDCDGSTDEDFNTQTDLTNCGACGTSCVATAGANSFPTACLGGVCQFACQSSYWDVNGDIALGNGGNGCEYGCTITNGGVEKCGDGIDNDCDGVTDEGFDLQNDIANCGACSYACVSHAGPNSSATGCALGACQFACNVGYVDLNGDVLNGNTGNGCEYPCLVTNGGVEACDSVDNDCNGTVDDGFDLQTDASNCGVCGNACSASAGNNSSASGCAGGVCQYACNAGFWDLNGNLQSGSGGDGCEYACTVTNGGVENCDGVDNDCDGLTDEDAGGSPLTQTCFSPGYGPLTGCTAPGACLGTCKEGTQTCGGGAWGACNMEIIPAPEICDGKDNDCDGSTDEGYDTATDVNNCGACGASCWTSAPADSYPNACVGGVCQYLCSYGFNDLNGDLNSGGGDGCEYTCPDMPPGLEFCDGVDNDCDGIVDEGVAAPPGLCYQGVDGAVGVPGTAANNPCKGVTALCQDPDGAGGLPHSWYCQWPAAVEVDPGNPNGITGFEALCNGADGDCNGTPDDDFPLLGVACDDGGIGACRGTGTYICDVPQTGTVCDITSPGAAPGAETCDGVDEDCDGTPDNDTPGDMVHVVNGPFDFWIDVYEASRPDATAIGEGIMGHTQCSEVNRMPWTGVSWTDADAACAAQGKRLCTEAEWQQACEGPLAYTFPYGNVYDPEACNGKDYDHDCTVPDDDWVLPTGTSYGCPAPPSSLCVSDYNAYDLTGNVMEWTGTQVGVAPVTYRIRGGSYDNIEAGMTCGFDFISAAPTFRYDDLGFRCCADSFPP